MAGTATASAIMTHSHFVFPNRAIELPSRIKKPVRHIGLYPKKVAHRPVLGLRGCLSGTKVRAPLAVTRAGELLVLSFELGVGVEKGRLSLIHWRVREGKLPWLAGQCCRCLGG